MFQVMKESVSAEMVQGRKNVQLSRGFRRRAFNYQSQKIKNSEHGNLQQQRRFEQQPVLVNRMYRDLGDVSSRRQRFPLIRLKQQHSHRLPGRSALRPM